MTRVFIANFGRENFEWPNCLARNTVTTMQAEEVHDFWQRNDQEGYVRYCIENMKTASNITPTLPVASRWFKLMTIVSETAGDIRIHRERDQLWWTISKSEPPTYTREIDPKALHGSGWAYFCRKPSEPWSNSSKRGNRLEWNALHAKAKHFLFTEASIQQLSAGNATYALALISGDDLTSWHSRPEWRAQAEASRRNPGTVFNARQRSVWQMTEAVKQEIAYNGSRNAVELRLSEQELTRYVKALLDDQGDTCAITGIPLQFDREAEDPEMLCALDRIDSGEHYQVGNLQVLCRFVKRWKGGGKDDEFRRLVGIVAAAAT